MQTWARVLEEEAWVWTLLSLSSLSCVLDDVSATMAILNDVRLTFTFLFFLRFLHSSSKVVHAVVGVSIDPVVFHKVVLQQAIDLVDNSLTSDDQLTTHSQFMPGSTIGALCAAMFRASG